ncbi:hypothetical protein ABZ816_14530 [Actinosynnema sp. NPDC047251]|uniref:Putative membrane protein n=1 Tax=Saccharothrix espanaensis (strain ATCC 51144 / DSM 44229 / JCM 9112 / NBRC 15066 / NRRL 15764) TaxID=1179773 RepID=K0JQP2_SACES|nr:hypothetical protein [Saccharothrix espanaensis]CCH29760.1 putative membrane protein [Saccharothrix espanaensis DSM 44229]
MTFLAHGVGERHDLPLPLDLVLQGAAVALLASFLALGLLWTTPRFTPRAERASREWWPVQVLILAALPFVPGQAWPHLVFVLLWVGLAVVSMLFGPVWRVVNPLRLAARVTLGRAYPERLGHWPAALGLLVFTWVELVEPHALPWFLLGYAVVNVAGGVVFGRTWFERADGFEVYSTLLGRLSPLRGNPFRTLVATPVRPGLVAVVAVCLGSTAFDSIGATPTWARLAPVPDWLGLVLAVAVVAGSFTAACRRTSGDLAHSLIPIVAGYVVAHYYSLLVVEGQRAVALLFGTRDFTPVDTPAAPVVVASVQIGAVLTGHLLAVVSAHDRALRLLPGRQHLTGQVPLLVLMVGYTSGGLALLFAG